MIYNDGKAGFLTTIIGPMFSEKSGELIKRCKQAEKYQNKKVVVYKPVVDNRYSEDEVVSRIGLRIKAYKINQNLKEENIEKEIFERCKDADMVAFDETQFFSREIVDIVTKLLNMKKEVIVDGLNLDYLGRPFGSMGDLMTISDEVVLKTAFCKCCGRPAMFTQRLIDGKPDIGKTGNLVQIGDTESYEPRCRLCYKSPLTEE